MKLFFVVNSADFLVSHRLEICMSAMQKGFDVHVICPKSGSASDLANLGINVHFIDFSRNHFNFLIEIFTIFRLFFIFKSFSPDIVHLITIKPYLYGGIAARLAGVKSIVTAVAGLGILFSSSDFKYRFLRIGLYPLFKYAFGHSNQIVIFQNVVDRNTLVNWRVVVEDKVRIIRGSGVDLSSCPVLPEPNDIPIVSFAARLLKDKGVVVFVEASRLLKSCGVNVRFWLIGEPVQGNVNSVSYDELKHWESEGLVELFGFRKDIPSLFSQSNIVTLPSFYGEGLPKVLIEAAACARCVITTDHAGCRDAVEPDTAILIPIQDAQALADAILYLIDNPDKRKSMGSSGRKLAEAAFDVNKVVERHIEIYHELLGKALY